MSYRKEPVTKEQVLTSLQDATIKAMYTDQLIEDVKTKIKQAESMLNDLKFPDGFEHLEGPIIMEVAMKVEKLHKAFNDLQTAQSQVYQVSRCLIPVKPKQ